ncbi:MAG: 16S rRNA (uracil(1498)-N(3))-methyltransferase [Actinobacteria bacterium]|nr:16S rRNA (uracil(1498)-N(3))-methyltransferase [Actinomycetota bacterium]
MSDGFFVAALDAGVHVGSLVTLDGPEGRHAAVVRRIGLGENGTVTNGEGRGVRGPVVAVRKDGLDVEVGELLESVPPRPRVVCVQALPKNERAEQAVDLLTEIGVDEIVPWQASRSIVRWSGERGDKALAKWRAVAREAAKQSRRLTVPVIAPLATTAQVAVRLAASPAAYVLHEGASLPVAAVRPPRSEIILVVGPEGGIAPDELAAFEAAGATAVLIADTVLRSVTAGAVAVAQLRLLASLAGAGDEQ